ncbi:ABC transporter substrate-binding protein [Pararhodobacter sp.]|uniref:ABC transporter substrate-binding protein n=1 Tax=Pararhodobacter sp. TaxID=2127056 RepID=UPI002AFFBD58|nr:substrate-binding domain-containing protein [Pararhodobacter sp.]
MARNNRMPPRRAWPRFRLRLAGLGAALLALAAPPAGAEVLRILTSLPPATTAPLVEAFRAHHPGTEVLVLNKNTVAAVEELLRGNARAFDVFFASSPEAFEILSRDGRFAGDGSCAAAGQAGYAPFAISSIGWTLRRDGGQRVPRSWEELLDRRYEGQIGMAPPSRSGTSHMLVERFLQVRGWNDGWGFLLRLARNLATVTSRSFAVTDGVRSGRFDIGLTIDFLAGSSQPELMFHYGTPAVLFPAQIGVLAGAGDPGMGCAFLTLVTGDEGQRLMLTPGIGRIPASAPVREEAGALIPSEITTALRSRWLDYNAGLASDRFWAVNVLFDLAITDRLETRRLLWSRLEALRGRGDGHALDLLARQLSRLPVSESEVLNLDRGPAVSRVMELTDLPAAQRALIRNWDERIAGQLAAIDGALTALEGRAP